MNTVRYKSYVIRVSRVGEALIARRVQVEDVQIGELADVTGDRAGACVESLADALEIAGVETATGAIGAGPPAHRGASPSSEAVARTPPRQKAGD